MKITIATSTYNTKPEYLEALWQSIRHQRGSTDWQWIIRDDGSTTRWIDTHNDPRVIYFKGENIGRGASMKEVMSRPEVTGWVLHVDADDWLELRAVESVAEAIEANPEASLIYSDHWAHRLTRTDDGRQIPSIAEDLLFGSRMFHMIVMNVAAYHKTEGYNPKYRWSSDYDVWLKLQEVGRFHHLPEQLYHWREHAEQMFHNFRDEQLFCGYKAVKAACIRRGLKLKPVLNWAINAIE